MAELPQVLATRGGSGGVSDQQRLDVDGWEVAQVELEVGWGWGRPADKCSLYRSPTTWTLVAVRRQVRYGDDGEPVSGGATITTSVFATVEELAEYVNGAYTGSAWVELLDAGYENDDELYRAWGPERIGRDFYAASIYNKDLARYTGLLGGKPVPAPARELTGWEAEAVAAMAANLVEAGFEVLDDRPVLRFDDRESDPVLGALRVRRYGWDSVGVVRVDGAGEIFVRVPDPSEVDGPLWQPTPEDVEDAW